VSGNLSYLASCAGSGRLWLMVPLILARLRSQSGSSLDETEVVVQARIQAVASDGQTHPAHGHPELTNVGRGRCTTAVSRHDLTLTTARLSHLAAPGTARWPTVLATKHDADQGHMEGTRHREHAMNGENR
jgi:hypothetical protein